MNGRLPPRDSTVPGGSPHLEGEAVRPSRFPLKSAFIGVHPWFISSSSSRRFLDCDFTGAETLRATAGIAQQQGAVVVESRDLSRVPPAALEECDLFSA